jgi:predicted HAD superfamily Cof-like phosphohydrolase
MQNKVKEFMQKAGQHTPDCLTIPSKENRELRVKLLLEEVLELAKASGVDIRQFTDNGNVIHEPLSMDNCIVEATSDIVDVVEVADAIADINYVSYGCAVTYGIDMEPVEKEVHRSNMSKFIDGYRRDDGKWIKGPSYSPANLKNII